VSESDSFQELTLANFFGAKTKSIGDEWFILYSRNLKEAQLVHICKPLFWIKAHSSGSVLDDDLITYVYLPAKREETCKCKKQIPKRVWNTYLLATMGLDNG
jgi:hypothetical protein